MRDVASKVLVIFLTLALGAAALAAQLPFLGGEILLNHLAEGNQVEPDVALAEDGSFAAVWLTAPLFGGTDAVLARVFGPDGEPLGTDLSLDEDTLEFVREPTLAALAGGGWVAAWSRQLASQADVFFRVLAADGTPLGPPTRAWNAGGVRAVPRVAGLADGGFVVGWTEVAGVLFVGPLARLFDADGTPRGAAFDLGAQVGEGRTLTDLEPLPGGGFVAVWTGDTQFADHGIAAQRYAADGTAVGLIFPVNTTLQANHNFARVTALPDGDLLFVWRRFASSQLGAPRAWMRRFSANGVARGGEVALAVDDNPVVAADSLGNVLVVGDSFGEIKAQLYRPSGEPVGEPVIVNTIRELSQGEPAVASNRRGQFVVAWSSGDTIFPGIPPGPPEPSQDGDGTSVAAQRFQRLCAVRDDVLCLQQGRFSVSVEWHRRGGATGVGTARDLTGDTGTFWFFRDANVELMVKVLDGRPVNDHYWVFWGSMTNVGFDLRVVDELTGARQVYRNPLGVLRSGRDTRAFAEAVPVTAPPPAAAAGPTSATAPPPDALFFHRGRIAVRVTWRNPRTGATGQGVPVPLTDESGAFWFFRQSNLESVVKVLDGGPVNGFFWVLFGSLTDVEYTMTVSDAMTGASREYRSPAGAQASGADVEALVIATPF